MKVMAEGLAEEGAGVDRLVDRLAAAAPLASAEDMVVALARLDLAAAVSWLEHAAAAGNAPRGAVVEVCVRGAAVADGAWSGRLLGVAASTGAPLPAETLAVLAEKSEDAAVAMGLVDAALVRHPRSAVLLRAAAVLQERAGAVAAVDALLTRLVVADPSHANVRNVARWRERLPSAGGRDIRVALLSSFTVDLLAPHVDAQCRLLGLEPRVYVAPFNAWEREAIDPGAGVRAFQPAVTFLSVSVDDLVPGLAGPLGDAELDAAADMVLERVVGAAAALSGWSAGAVVVHGFHSMYADPLGVAAGRAERSRTQWLAELNRRLAQALRDMPRCHTLDVQDVLLRRSGGGFDDAKMRQFARIRFTAEGAARLAQAYAAYIAPVAGVTRKCVVLDLDNTLWGGVIGEDGMEGIRLGSTAPGVEFIEFQQYLQSLSRRGVLLAIASKNNAEDALQVLREHPSMLLREDAFAAVRINWGPKPESVREIANELNIGLDALVFIDDNPNERELMRQALPEVLTPDMPTDPAQYRGVLEQMPQLQSLVVTEEDRTRVELYRARRQREQVRVQAGTLDDYLASLQVQVTVAVDDARGADRIHQLLHRTNQFNVTTRRHGAADVAQFIADPSWRVYGVRARDRFGDHGLSAAAIVQTAGEEWRIDSLLMSCRVISYGIETALLAAVAEDAAAGGAAVLHGEFIPSAKNAPARDFYARHGFDEAGEADGVQAWRLALTRRPACPSWIGMERE